MKKFLLTLALCLCFCMMLPLAACASEIGGETAEQGIFVLLYERIGAHLPQILSALSALGALVIVLCYKKGLLPLLKSGLNAISAATKEWGKNAEAYGKEAKEICENANNYIQISENKTEEIEKSIQRIEQKLLSFEKISTDSEQTKNALLGQMDMLCEIFLSSALPQFEKDRVSQKIEKMKQAITAPKPGGESDA